jgi:hypothetical protein
MPSLPSILLNLESDREELGSKKEVVKNLFSVVKKE